MSFAKWSESNPQACPILSPDMGIRSWDNIGETERTTILKYFSNKQWFDKDNHTFRAIWNFNEDHKAKTFCNHTLNHGGAHYTSSYGDERQFTKDCCHSMAQLDFTHIFIKEKQDVVYQLISYYASELESNYDAGKLNRFINAFNDISNQFGLNVLLTTNGFVFRQDDKITNEIFIPVLKFLSDGKWEPVNRDLCAANIAYLKNKEEEFSRSVTLTISALQAFLQILVNGQTGKGNIGDLIGEAQTKGLIPNDSFTTKIFKDIESVLMKERQHKGDAHSKKEYADEKVARLVLNLTMIFMQHCLQ